MIDRKFAPGSLSDSAGAGLLNSQKNLDNNSKFFTTDVYASMKKEVGETVKAVESNLDIFNVGPEMTEAMLEADPGFLAANPNRFPIKDFPFVIAALFDKGVGSVVKNRSNLWPEDQQTLIADKWYEYSEKEAKAKGEESIAPKF